MEKPRIRMQLNAIVKKRRQMLCEYRCRAGATRTVWMRGVVSLGIFGELFPLQKKKRQQMKMRVMVVDEIKRKRKEGTKKVVVKRVESLWAGTPHVVGVLLPCATIIRHVNRLWLVAVLK